MIPVKVHKKCEEKLAGMLIDFDVYNRYYRCTVSVYIKEHFFIFAFAAIAPATVRANRRGKRTAVERNRE